MNEDSGMMLCSKYPFAKFRMIPNSRLLTTTAFHAFTACQGMDCCADKGVGLVVVDKPSTCRAKHVVAFTHLNEDGMVTR